MWDGTWKCQTATTTQTLVHSPSWVPNLNECTQRNHIHKRYQPKFLATCLAIWILQGKANGIFVKWSVATSTSTELLFPSSAVQKSMQTRSIGSLCTLMGHVLQALESWRAHTSHSTERIREHELLPVPGSTNSWEHQLKPFCLTHSLSCFHSKLYLVLQHDQ